MTIGWGIVGTGGIARLMANAIRQTDAANIAAVCSRDLERSASFATTFGASEHYSSYDELLADPKVEVVYIATPNALHGPQAIAALDAGKHVLVEKPMALTVAEAQQTVIHARAAQRLLGVGFHLRHHPVHLEVKRLIERTELGHPIFGSAIWGSYSPDLAQQRERWQMQADLAGAGSIMGLGVHEIDLLRWLLGQEVVEVTAMTDGPNDTYPVEFLTAATLRFSGGAIANIVSSRRLPNTTNTVTIYGTKCRIEAEETLGMMPSGHLRVTNGAESTIRKIPLRDCYLTEAETFSTAVHANGQFAASGEDGVRSVAITSAILEAARSGRTVHLNDVDLPHE